MFPASRDPFHRPKPRVPKKETCQGKSMASRMNHGPHVLQDQVKARLNPCHEALCRFLCCTSWRADTRWHKLTHEATHFTQSTSSNPNVKPKWPYLWIVLNSCVIISIIAQRLNLWFSPCCSLSLTVPWPKSASRSLAAALEVALCWAASSWQPLRAQDDHHDHHACIITPYIVSSWSHLTKWVQELRKIMFCVFFRYIKPERESFPFRCILPHRQFERMTLTSPWSKQTLRIDSFV